MEDKDLISENDRLLVNYLTGEAGDEEREAAIAWLKESAENHRYFDELLEIYKVAKVTEAEDVDFTSASWEKVKARHYRQLAEKFRKENKERKFILIRDIFKYAAFITLAVSIGYAGFRFFTNRMFAPSAEIWNTIEAPYGSRVRLTLADGSRVWLNAGSNLKYSSRFGQDNRKVILNGEAYFSVVSDSSKQFIVSTSHLNIKVYGTEFNVKAYSDEDKIETTLVSGSIILEGDLVLKSGKRWVTLEPNQTATYYITDRNYDREKDAKVNEIKSVPKVSMNKAENLIITPDINPVLYTSWKDPVWYIDGESLQSLAIKFERRFNIKFILDSKSIQNYRFTGTLKDEPLELVLNVLELSFPIDYQIINNQVIISENKYFKNYYDEMLIKKAN
jgi:transmembrane sensor